MKELFKDVQALQKLIQRGQKPISKSGRGKHQGLYPRAASILTQQYQLSAYPIPGTAPRSQRGMEVLTAGGLKVFSSSYK